MVNLEVIDCAWCGRQVVQSERCNHRGFCCFNCQIDHTEEIDRLLEEETKKGWTPTVKIDIE